MANVTFTNKSQTDPYSAALINAQDMNELKARTNEKADRPLTANITSASNMPIDLGDVLTGSKGIHVVGAFAHDGGVFGAPSNGYDGQEFEIVVVYTGDVAPDWNSAYKFADNIFSKPIREAYTRINGAIDVFRFKKRGAAMYCVGQFFNYQ
jgi:hypothetical protein